MTQEFNLQIAGEPVEVLGATLIRNMDHPSDFFRASIGLDRINDPKLYNQLKAPNFTPATISLNGELQLTGNVTGRGRSKSDSGIATDISGMSRTFNFIQSHLVPPYEYSLIDLKAVTEDIAKQTGTQVVFNADPGGPFNRVAARRGQTGAQFIAPLAFKKSLVMSCDEQGALLFDVANVDGVPVGVLDESTLSTVFVTEWSVNFEDTKRYRTYKATSSSPFGNAQGIATDTNINQPRHRVIEASDIKGTVVEHAEYLKNTAFIADMSIPIPVSDWYAPNGKLWATNTLVTIKSETLFIPDGFTFMIRQVDFTFAKSEQRAVIHIIPPKRLHEKVSCGTLVSVI